MEITPSPPTSLLLAGIQHQSREYSRGLRPHGTKDWMLVTTVAGEGYVKAEATTCTLRRGDMLLVAPNTPQEYGFRAENSHWSNIWVHFQPRPHWHPWLAWPQVSRGVMLLPGFTRLEEIEAELRLMTEVSHGPARLRQDAAMNRLERVLLLADELNPCQIYTVLDRRIKRALEIVGERLAEPLTVAGLGKSVGLSRSRFSVLFNKNLNISPQAFIEFERLARAAQLLQSSSWSVTQISEEVGFPNAFYFSTRFRLRYGAPPTVYRNRLGEFSSADSFKIGRAHV